jgi:hypothetical protein
MQSMMSKGLRQAPLSEFQPNSKILPAADELDEQAWGSDMLPKEAFEPCQFARERL